MKFTTVYITFNKTCTFEDMYKFIFYPDSNVSVPPTIKCFRRYRTYIVGFQYMSNNEFSFTFSFPKKQTLIKFRDEFAEVTKGIPK